MDRGESVIKIDFEGLICIFCTQNKMCENYPKITKDVKTREESERESLLKDKKAKGEE